MRKNILFKETEEELLIINEISHFFQSDFSIFRITPTMYEKSIIDASHNIRTILKEKDIIDFDCIEKGEKQYYKSILITDSSDIELKTSFYRPQTKDGDPRFWPNGFKKYINQNDLILFTSYNKNPVLIHIDISNKDTIKSNVENLFKHSSDFLLQNLEEKLIKIREQGWIDSVSINENNDNAVGLTLEKEFGIKPNSSQKADYFGEIEFKTKRRRSSTKDTLFSVVPDWDLCIKKNNSQINGELTRLKSKYFLVEHGIASSKHIGYKTLYVTVSSQPNAQGMFLEKNDNKKILFQYFNNRESACVWQYVKLKERFIKKHNRTVWIKADNRIKDNKVQFRYNSFQYSEKPSFNQFIELIPLNVITLDWTHRCLPDLTNYNDHGFLFRIKPEYRSMLFGIVKDIC